MTDNLRARIATALEECRVLTSEAQADAVMAVVQPEIDGQRIRMQNYSRGRCRRCGATDPDWPWPERNRRPHAMYCRLYVGPLKHGKRGGRPGALGIGWVNDCMCGRSWRDEDGGCPDAAVDWRGPRPDGEDEACQAAMRGRRTDPVAPQCGHTRRITIDGRCGECTVHPPRRPTPDTMMPPEEWCRAYGVHVYDEDGWRGEQALGWGEPVTLVEFERRAALSTTDVANPAWQGVSRDARLCEQDEAR